jgi:hypothetical protein
MMKTLSSMKEHFDNKFPFAHDPQHGEVSPFGLIRQLYQEEKHSGFTEPTKVVSVSLPIKDVALFIAVSKRFDMSMSAFLASLLQGSARECMDALDPQDRIQLAKLADLEVAKIESEKGITVEYLGAKYDTWEYKASELNAIEEKELQQNKESNNDLI